MIECARGLGEYHKKGKFKNMYMPNIPKCVKLIKQIYKNNTENKFISLIKENYESINSFAESIQSEKSITRYKNMYDIAKEFVKVCEGKIKEENIITFINEYERINEINKAQLDTIKYMIKISLLHYLTEIYILADASTSSAIEKKGKATEENIQSLESTLKNIIKSIQEIDNIDWENIISCTSITEKIFNLDPANIFTKMTTKTKNEYLRILNVCAKRKGKKEIEYAKEILAKAQEEKKHIGELLYAEYTSKNEFDSFKIMFVFTTFVISLAPAFYAMEAATQKYREYGIIIGIFTTILIYFVSLNISFVLIQKMYMQRKMPFFLPEMDFEGGLPEDCKIMIVIPCMISTKQRIDEMIEQLKAAAWANPQEGICYTLLADLPESNIMKGDKDGELIGYAQNEIKKLGADYYIVIRDRVFYEADRKWRGYERKRGALIELNNKIIKAELPKVNYVLTIDADTIIPINTAIKMAQIMSHPLNKPQISYINGEPIVTKGYAILQPNIKSITRENATLFEKIYVGDTTYSTYDTKVSDFYFDICHEGIFTGKGMYEPHIFNGLLEDRFPDNTILSHDLIEGAFLRVGYASDICLYDYYPSTYGAYMKRQNRWMRGDWQLLRVKQKKYSDRNGKKRNNPINKYSRFKINMNLIRSLYYPVVLTLFLIGGIFLPKENFLWIFLISCALLINVGGKIWNMLIKAALDFIFLPHKAFESIKACFTALYRTYFSQKNMLEWEVFSETEKCEKDSALYYCRIMYINFGVAIIFLLFMRSVPAIIWIIGPYLAFFISYRKKQWSKDTLRFEQRAEYYMLAENMWSFYRDFATKNENYLPPDNVQYEPEYKIAHRTSPTNIGFLLVGTVIAEKLKFISFEEMLGRLTNIIDTIDKLEKWNGHIYNWYDTITLEPLEPKFVSTVDSGNFAACLLTTSQYIENHERLNKRINKEVTDKDLPELYEEKQIIKKSCNIAKRINKIFQEMNFKPLYNKKRKHFNIGFDVKKGQLTQSYYDILMSEARLASYVSMGKGDIGPEHFYYMAKRKSKKGKLLKSWSGTVFEYMMPEIFLPAPKNSEIGMSIVKMLDIQQKTARTRIWGVSESGYNEIDENNNYKYMAFGLKILAAKNKSLDDEVVAPYASLMASNYLPMAVYENIKKMEKCGLLGEYGFYEAIDYNRERYGIVKSYMAHHVGMALCGVGNMLEDNFVSKTFSQMPMMQGVKIMISEKYKKN